MLHYLTLGIIQGLAEWLPVSSEAMIILANTYLFHSSDTLTEQIQLALLLHLGTWLAALVYFRTDIIALCNAVLQYQTASRDTKHLLSFVIMSTLITSIFGYGLIRIADTYDPFISGIMPWLSVGIGLLLIGTGLLQLSTKRAHVKTYQHLTLTDGIILGVVQGLATLPGLSRSGTTVSALLLRKFDKTTALKLSFLMSIPIVFIGNIVLNLPISSVPPAAWSGVISSFISGIITIHILLQIAARINFGIFVVGFGILITLISLW